MTDLGTLNEWAMDWLGWMLGRSVVFAIAFVVVVPVALLLARKRFLGAHAVSALLWLPVVLLVVPIDRWLPEAWPSVWPEAVAAIELPIDAGEAAGGTVDRLDAPSTGVEAGEATASSAEEASRGDRFAPTDSAPSADAEGFWSLLLGPLALLVWSLVLVSTVVRIVRAQRRAERFLCETGVEPDPWLRELFGQACDRTGIRRPVGLFVSEELQSPATVGWFRPAVFLPKSSLELLSKREHEFVLLHELEHVRRGDVLLEALLRCLRTAFFFHPAAWATGALVRRWRELACDEAALARTGSSGRTPGAQALISLADPVRAAARERLATVPLLTDGETMMTRIERLLDPKRNPGTGPGARGLVAAALLGGVALTAVHAQKPVVEQARSAASDKVVARLDDVTNEAGVKAGLAFDQAIQEGVSWLLTRQEADGRFGLGPVPKSKPRDHDDAFTTALVIQALLNEADGPNAEVIEGAIARAVEYLILTQNEKGRIGDGTGFTTAYAHAQSLRSLALVQKRTPSERLKGVLERAVAYAEYHRNPYAGWRYEPKAGDNDSKITGLMMLGLIDAKRAGIEVPREALEGGEMILDHLTDETTGRTGFTEPGGAMSRFVWKNEDYPRKYTEEPTALRLLVAFESGEDLIKQRWMRRALDLLIECPPIWSPARGSIDYSYWQYAAEAMSHVDGYQRRLWRDRLAIGLAEHRQKSDSGAYWPAIDAWSSAGMENWSTASALLALQSLR